MEKHNENYGIVNKESFAEAFPELFKAIQEGGFDEGFKVGQVKGKSDAETAHKQASDESKMTIEEKAMKDWKSSADIRKEFRDIGTYYHYIKNIDKVKIIGGVRR